MGACSIAITGSGVGTRRKNAYGNVLGQKDYQIAKRTTKEEQTGPAPAGEQPIVAPSDAELDGAA